MGCTTYSNISGWMILTIFFIFFIPNIFAFDCNRLENKADCELLKKTNESLIANLIYTNSFYADHASIKNYNDNIAINTPTNNYKSNGIINNAWLEIISVSPSVSFNDVLYVPNNVQLRVEYGLGDVQLPRDSYYSSGRKKYGNICQINHYLYLKTSSLNIYANNDLVGRQKYSSMYLNSDALLKATLDVNIITESKEYTWQPECCRWKRGRCTLNCPSCEYNKNYFQSNSIHLEDSILVILYENNPYANLEFISKYYNSTKAKLENDNSINLVLSFNNSFIKIQNYDFYAEFYKEPYYLLQLKMKPKKETTHQNLILYDNIFYIKDISECNLKYSGFFETKEEECNYEYTEEEIENINRIKGSSSWIFILKLGVFICILYCIYKLIKKYWKI